jgi:hypothetical protein
VHNFIFFLSTAVAALLVRRRSLALRSSGEIFACNLAPTPACVRAPLTIISLARNHLADAVAVIAGTAGVAC